SASASSRKASPKRCRSIASSPEARASPAMRQLYASAKAQAGVAAPATRTAGGLKRKAGACRTALSPRAGRSERQIAPALGGWKHASRPRSSTMKMNVQPVPTLDEQTNAIRQLTADIVNKEILPHENELWVWRAD